MTEHTEHSTTDVILIDDDQLIQMVWKFAAKKAGKTIAVYGQAEGFFSESDRFSKDVPIYVDENLSGNIKGREVSKHIHNLGFKNIYLSTGYDPDTIEPAPWIRGIVGKDPRV